MPTVAIEPNEAAKLAARGRRVLGTALDSRRLTRLGGDVRRLAVFSAQLITPPATNVTHYWCAAIFSATNRAKLNVLTNTPPFAGHVLVLDYSLMSQPEAPFGYLVTNGLAVYAPPM